VIIPGGQVLHQPDDDGEPTVEADVVFEDSGQEQTEVFVQQRTYDLLASDPRELGQYQVERRLKPASGSFSVFVGGVRQGTAMAERLPPKVRLVFKTVAADADVVEREWLEREVRNGQRVRGAHVATVLDVGTIVEGPHTGMRYFVQEFIPGPPLSDYKHTPLPPDLLTPVAAGLLEALIDIHAADLVHRDIKPENVILSPRRGVIVIDFGIAHHVDDVNITSAGMVRATKSTVSPEQLAGMSGPASDTFSWAVTVAWAATGKHPFLSDQELADLTTQEVSDRIAAAPPRLRGIPEPVAGCLRAALVANPAQRPPMGILLDRLRAPGPGAQPHLWPAGTCLLEPTRPQSVVPILPDRPVNEPTTPLLPWLPSQARVRRWLRGAYRDLQCEIVDSRFVFALAMGVSGVGGLGFGAILHQLLTPSGR
jgi:serine/threonine protein kinase